MIAFPNAKINIGLNITSRRPDGYHNLETVFYPIKIYDALEIIKSDQVTFNASGLDIPGKITDNLCLKGYDLLKKDFDLPPVDIHLHKHIPIGAGLGGGSADAAFFIKLLNQYFNLGLSAEQMRGYARQLGADCAFFIESKPVYAFGKGDEFEPVSLDLSTYHLVLVMPPAHVSTAEAYRGVSPKPAEGPLQGHIGFPVKEWKYIIKNDFEESVFKNHPEIRGVKAALYDAGALYASMSGSGASVFGIFATRPDLSVLEKDNQVFYNI
ncbi:4-(cytidine 5'-diphospho)-2-C-methyl-D-erythritol kinase [Mucilaginibacter boryungensis]|uniref:4-diphosphocytidyl-2-C-methyl-D-erythritol kinase n=1 Tax=Mucilaginibacter boryungensis TaxID=768480 RepID=A0ABR9XH56_9SPHI|nr:4-(cytidine 5'-diphospho)-2-C-methyl-D-erythritol kinase [Mucilaginibacter boryungensis]MBE9666726.1 4-(cytidine 5'-diphospho)-2-C-methyl-D-erythritol kinase [Mucilaginibacter boryungensis]